MLEGGPNHNLEFADRYGSSSINSMAPPRRRRARGQAFNPLGHNKTVKQPHNLRRLPLASAHSPDAAGVARVVMPANSLTIVRRDSGRAAAGRRAPLQQAVLRQFPRSLAAQLSLQSFLGAWYRGRQRKAPRTGSCLCEVSGHGHGRLTR